MGDAMMDIELIYNLLDWKNSEKVQAEGIEMAAEIPGVQLFLQPNTEKYNKNIWENCAKIVSARDDRELSGHLMQLFEWLQDMNWPGAECISDRLACFSDNVLFEEKYNICIHAAETDNDDIWLNNLISLKKKRISNLTASEINIQ